MTKRETEEINSRREREREILNNIFKWAKTDISNDRDTIRHLHSKSTEKCRETDRQMKQVKQFLPRESVRKRQTRRKEIYREAQDEEREIVVSIL